MGVLEELNAKRQEGTQNGPGSQISPSAVQEAVMRFGGFLPAAGGLAGGLLGGGAGTVFGLGVGSVPGAIGGAGLGGAGGQAAEQLLRRSVGLGAPESSSEAAKQIGLSGGEQALAEAGGRALAPVIGAGTRILGKNVPGLAKGLMQAALGPEGYARTDAAATALREGISASKAGVRKLVGKIMEGSTQAERLVSARHLRRIVMDPMRDIADQAERDVLEQLGKGTESDAARRQLKELKQGFVGDTNNRHGVTVPRLLEIKRDSDKIAKPIYNALNKPDAVVAASDIVRARWNRALADRARTLLYGQEGGAQGLVPGLKAVEQRLGELKDLRRVVTRRGKGEVGIAAKLAGRGAAGTAGAVAGAAYPAGSYAERAQHAAEAAALASILGSPGNVSNLALLLSSPLAQLMVRQIPRGIGAAQAGEVP